MGFSPIGLGARIRRPRVEQDVLVSGQHAGRGATAVDPQLAAGALDQGVGARLGDPHQRADFLGQTVLRHPAQRLAFALGEQLDAGRCGGGLPVHDAGIDRRERPTRRVRCKNALQPAKAKPIVRKRSFQLGRAF